MNTKKNLFKLLSAVAIVIAIIYAVSYISSLRTMVVNFQNIDKVLVYDTKKVDKGEGEKPIGEVLVSGQELKLKKGKYTLKYEALENYQDLFVEVNLREKRQVVELKPSFSEEYLNKQLDKEFPGISRALLRTFPKIKDLYKIQRGKLYHDGGWYGTVLTYRGRGPLVGEELFKTDSLRVVLKKENGVWVVKTDPPNILLNKYAYGSVPADILRDVNTLPAN